MNDTHPSHFSILVVEDSEDFRNLFVISLQRAGYFVHAAPNGLDALEALALHHIDLILTDLMMPIMDGFELLEKVKSAESLSHIPVIVCSALCDDQNVKMLRQIGAAEAMEKPFTCKDLLVRVQTHLSAKTSCTVGH